MDKPPPARQADRSQAASGPATLHASIESLPLEDLLQLVARGSRAALHRLYDLEAGRLYAIALRIVRRPDAAADVVQDGFLQIWRGAGTFDPALGSAAAWITGIIRYRALDAARRLGREAPAEALPDRATDEADALQRLQQVREAASLRRCLEQLDEKNRRCITLAFVDGFSHAQVARQLDLPLGTVKAWIRRGLAALRSCLES